MFSLKNEKRAIKVFLAVACGLFFLICLFSIFKYGNSTLLGKLYDPKLRNINDPNNDDVKFIRSAVLLIQTGKYQFHVLGTHTVFMMPGLVFTLAFFIKLFGLYGGMTALRIFQAVLQTGSIMLVFFIARKIFNSKVGVLAVVLSIVYTADYWIANLILTESIFKFLVLCLVYFSIYAIEKRNVKCYVLGGLAWGLATLFRPTISIFPIIILIMWLIKKYSFKEMLKYGTATCIVFCILLAPWWIRNYSVFGKFIPFTLATGNPMLQGTYIDYDQAKSHREDGLSYTNFVYTSDSEAIKSEVTECLSVSDSEIIRNEMEIAQSKYRLRNLIPKKPFQFLYWYTVGKTKCQVLDPFLWIDILGVKISFVKTYHQLILILSIIGSIFYFLNRKKNKLGIIPFATIIYFILIYLPFFCFARYFYPAIPCVIIFAAYGIIRVMESGKILLFKHLKRS